MNSGPTPPLVLLVYDMFGANANEMDAAQRTVRELLRLAAIPLDWHLCPEVRDLEEIGHAVCGAPPSDTALLVRIVSATTATPPWLLGNALVAREGFGVLATVYADRIQAASARSRVDPGNLLGRTIAHEVAHLIMGALPHDRNGLMRARWSPGELRRDVPGDWTWSPQDIEYIRQAFEIRAHRSIPVPSPPRVAERTPETTTVPTCRSRAKCS